MTPLIVIPARLNSTRLPGKALADIHGQPVIVHVMRQATKADVGPVVVATDTREIAAAVEQAGGRAVQTLEKHQSGSDRSWQAATIVDPQERHDVIVNVQGDQPALDPDSVRSALAALADPAADIGTLAIAIESDAQRTDSNVVKLIGTSIGPNRLRALYFTRATAPWGDGELLRHVGIYAYRRAALERFVGLAPSPLEQRERLEQLRALEAGMRIDAVVVSNAASSVDTPADLELARKR